MGFIDDTQRTGRRWSWEHTQAFKIALFMDKGYFVREGGESTTRE